MDTVYWPQDLGRKQWIKTRNWHPARENLFDSIVKSCRLLDCTFENKVSSHLSTHLIYKNFVHQTWKNLKISMFFAYRHAKWLFLLNIIFSPWSAVVTKILQWGFFSTSVYGTPDFSRHCHWSFQNQLFHFAARSTKRLLRDLLWIEKQFFWALHQLSVSSLPFAEENCKSITDGFVIFNLERIILGSVLTKYHLSIPELSCISSPIGNPYLHSWIFLR